MYDKEDNGLKLSNSWAGYYILLNPDFKQQVCVCVAGMAGSGACVW